MMITPSVVASSAAAEEEKDGHNNSDDAGALRTCSDALEGKRLLLAVLNESHLLCIGLGTGLVHSAHLYTHR